MKNKKKRTSWNKGLTKETSPLVARLSKKMSATKLLAHKPAWNRGLRCPRDPEVAKRAGRTFSKNYAAGLIVRPEPKWLRHEYKLKDGRKIYFKSSYELTFATMLDSVGAEWFYEPKRFMLSNGKVYTPDFLVLIPKELQEIFGREWEFVEVKGWFRSSAKKIVARFKRDYPTIPFRLVDHVAMQLMQVLEKSFTKKKMTPREIAMLDEFETQVKDKGRC